MPPTNPRIIVVDEHQGLYDIVRAALELMGRRPRLIETHSGDDAMVELRVSSPDLLLSAHTLPGTTNGPMLALMAKRELAALPIIVVGTEDDPEMDQDTLSQSPFVYLRRPFVPEKFLRELRIALDGPEAVPQEVAPTDIMGPVPVIDAEKLRPIMFRLMRDVGAMAAVMADRNGKVTIYEGAAGYFDRDLLAAALGPGFGHTAKMLSVIGEKPRVLKFYDAERLDLYALSVGLHHFIILAFEGGASNVGKRAIGAVNRYGPAAVNEMLDLLGEVAFSTKPVAAPGVKRETREMKAAKEAPAPAKEERGSRRRRTTQEAKPLPPTPAPAKAVEKKAEPVPAAEALELPAIENFDASIFDTMGEVDLSQADDLFDPDKLAASATSGSGNRISFEDAMMQGIIGDVEE